MYVRRPTKTVTCQSTRVLSPALRMLDLLLHIAVDKRAAPKQPPEASRGTLANALIDAAHCHPDHLVTQSVAKVLTDTETGRWTVDQEVLAMAAQTRFSLEDVCKHFAQTIRSPHRALWMEFEPCSHIGADFEDIFDRYGVLFTQASGCSLDICFAGRVAGMTYVTPFIAQVGHDGANVSLKARSCFSSHEAIHVVAEGEMILPFILKQVTEALRVLIVCTARRTPVVRGPLNDFTKVNKARAKQGKTTHVPNQTIRWGLEPQKANTNGSTTARTAIGEGRHLRRHMQRGHYKLRETGPYWWSHHFRGRAGGNPAPGRDHNVFGRAPR